MAPGQQVEAGFAALPGETVGGPIDHLRMTMDPQTRTQAVVIAVDNSGGKLRPGMFGRVRISVQVAKDAIVGPEQEPAEETPRGVVAVAHGSIELPTDQQALATPPVVGRVCRILVQPSQHVGQGQVLAEIDSPQLRSVQLDLLQTLTKARLIEQYLTRLE